MRLRPVGANRLTLALANPQVIDDPGTEQEHEQRAGHHRPAGAEGDVAEDVQEAAQEGESGDGVGKLDQPVKHSICPIARLGYAVLPGKRIASALTIVFILKTKQILVMITAAHQRITAEITGGSVRPVYAFACKAASSLGTNLLTQNIFL